MAQQTLYPGPVSVFKVAGVPQESVVVGAPPQWADNDDSTYATAWLTTRAEAAVQATAEANLDPFTGTPAGVTGITAYMRASTENLLNATAGRFTIDLYNAANDWVVNFGYTTNHQILPGDGIVDLVLPLTQTDLDAFFTTLPAVAAELATGGRVLVYRYSMYGDPIPGDYAITVYELKIVVDYEQVSGRRAPLRVVQRGNDGLGFTGGRRVVGARSVQSSNRRGAAIR